MQREPGLKWLFLDLNSYFASVEQQENPALRGRPVAVLPMMTDHTCAIAASYEAKAYGVKTGTIIRDARRLCPDLQCVPARHDVYVAYHNRIVSEVARHTPINKIWSIDELSSRLPPGKRTPDAARALAARIKAGLRGNIGPAITCSIGFAPNSLLAKIAADMKKPDGLTLLRQEDLPGPLLRLKLTDLPGIGRNMERRLHRANVRSVEDFWKLPAKLARRIWGSVEGERFWYLLHGYDLEAPATKNVMIGHSRVLDPHLRDAEKARLMARRLMTKAAFRLRSKNFYTRTIFLSVRTAENMRWSAEIPITAAQDSFSLLRGLDALWREMLRDDAVLMHMRRYGPLRLRKLSVILSGLVRREDITDDLLDAANSRVQARLAKCESLTRALDTLQRRYAREVVSLGLPPQTLAGYVGTKIAFSRVPEEQEFWS